MSGPAIWKTHPEMRKGQRTPGSGGSHSEEDDDDDGGSGGGGDGDHTTTVAHHGALALCQACAEHRLTTNTVRRVLAIHVTPLYAADDTATD